MHFRKSLLIQLLFFANLSLFAQINADTSSQKSDTIKEFHEVSQMAQFAGGNPSMYQYFTQNINYPVEAKKNKIEGRVLVQFVIHSDGSISDAKILGSKTLGYGIEEEAIRIVLDSPKWEPARIKDKEVPVRFRMPIKFELPK